MNDFYHWLVHRAACSDALNWIWSKRAKRPLSPKQAWDRCRNGEWMLWFLVRAADLHIEGLPAFEDSSDLYDELVGPRGAALDDEAQDIVSRRFAGYLHENLEPRFSGRPFAPGGPR